MLLKNLLKLLDEHTTITVCYAGGKGERLYKGPIKGDIPKHVLDYTITYLLPSGSNLYLEVHELSTFVSLDD